MERALPRTLLIATSVLWAVAYAAWTAGWMLEPMPFALDRALRRLPLCLGGALLCLGIAHGLNRIRSWRPVYAAVAVVAAAALHAFANEIAFYVFDPRWGPPAWRHIPDVMMGDFWVYAAWALLYFALDAEARRRDQEVQLAQADAARIEVQHRMLLQQLNPHFLFNALNTVYALVLEADLDGAKRAVLALSSLLRRTLEKETSTLATFDEEITLLSDYLEIERARFADRLRVDLLIPAACRGRRLPPMLLQPLVENCVKHGLSGQVPAMTVRIRSEDTPTHWAITVEDDGASFGASGHGIGLANIERRLHILYGDDASLEAHALADGGFIARILLPLPS